MANLVLSGVARRIAGSVFGSAGSNVIPQRTDGVMRSALLRGAGTTVKNRPTLPIALDGDRERSWATDWASEGAWAATHVGVNAPTKAISAMVVRMCVLHIIVDSSTCDFRL